MAPAKANELSLIIGREKKLLRLDMPNIRKILNKNGECTLYVFMYILFKKYWHMLPQILQSRSRQSTRSLAHCWEEDETILEPVPM